MRKLRKMLCFGLAVAIAMSVSVSANAESTVDDGVYAVETELTVEPDDNELVLVSSEEVTLEDGQIVKVDTYLEDGVAALANTKGSQYYKCTAKFLTADNPEIVLWVYGTFHWDSEDNRAYVIGADGNYDIKNTSYTYENVKKGSGDDVGRLFFGKRYAYVEIELKFKDAIYTSKTYKLSFDVNVNGEYHSSTGITSASVSVTT